jgi:hypothetical protein
MRHLANIALAIVIGLVGAVVLSQWAVEPDPVSWVQQ